jgi:hypothetical protein
MTTFGEFREFLCFVRGHATKVSQDPARTATFLRGSRIADASVHGSNPLRSSRRDTACDCPRPGDNDGYGSPGARLRAGTNLPPGPTRNRSSPCYAGGCDSHGGSRTHVADGGTDYPSLGHRVQSRADKPAESSTGGLKHEKSMMPRRTRIFHSGTHAATVNRQQQGGGWLCLAAMCPRGALAGAARAHDRGRFSPEVARPENCRFRCLRCCRTCARYTC